MAAITPDGSDPQVKQEFVPLSLLIARRWLRVKVKGDFMAVEHATGSLERGDNKTQIGLANKLNLKFFLRKQCILFT